MRCQAGVLWNSQPSAAPDSAARAMMARIVTSTMSIQLPPLGTLSSNPTPIGSRTKIKGTMKAGSVYFHDCSVVLYGSPPVIAAAAKGESAVGGDTSESTA